MAGWECIFGLKFAIFGKLNDFKKRLIMERHRLSSAIVLSIAIVVSGIMLPVGVKNYNALVR